jgi:hypothetical protein
MPDVPVAPAPAELPATDEPPLEPALADEPPVPPPVPAPDTPPAAVPAAPPPPLLSTSPPLQADSTTNSDPRRTDCARIISFVAGSEPLRSPNRHR